MTLHPPAEALVAAASALVHEHDVTDLLLRLTQEATRFTGGDVGGLLVVSAGPPRRLEVLATTDHVATHLEVYQAQRDEGPCVDVVTTGRPVLAVGGDEIVSRWPSVGRAIAEAGFHGAQAYPLTWRGVVLGGLNVFTRHDRAPNPEESRTARAFADMLTLVVTRPERLHEDELARRLRDALDGRVVVEQAKGALAHRLGVDMGEAYASLLERTRRDGATLTATAHAVLREAQEG